MKKSTILSVLATLWPFARAVRRRAAKDYWPLLKVIVFVVLLLILFGSIVSAQELPSALKVGDKVPQTFWKSTHAIYSNGSVTKENLERFKGKLLLLDFWATWCGSCLHKFSYLDSLQRKEGGRLNIVLVNTKKTGDQLELIKVKLQDFEKDGFNLPTIYEDVFLKSQFPHYLVPHYAWINSEGIIIAFTGSDFVNNLTVQNAIGKTKKTIN